MVFQRSGGLEGNAISVETLRVLNLTDDQKTKFAAAQQKLTEATLPVGRGGGNAGRAGNTAGAAPNTPALTPEQIAANTEANAKAREAFQAELKGILTKEQVAKAEELMKNVPEYLQQQQRGGAGGVGQGNAPGARGGNAAGTGAGRGGNQGNAPTGTGTRGGRGGGNQTAPAGAGGPRAFPG